MPPLVQCVLMYYQFEAIHPYLDGNGCIGRLLIVLLMGARSLLKTPLLYLSTSFEREKTRYHDELFAMSRHGDGERWLRYAVSSICWTLSGDSFRPNASLGRRSGS